MIVSGVQPTEHTIKEVSEAKRELLWDTVERTAANLTTLQRDKLYEALLCYEDVFAVDNSDLGCTNRLKHHINTGDAAPVRQLPRRISPHRQEEVTALLTDMENQGIIQPSKSPWASPVVLVRKKDNTLCFCVDYRKVNELTKKDAYPLPRVDDTLETLSGSKWFSTLDLLSGYWQVKAESVTGTKQHLSRRKDSMNST